MLKIQEINISHNCIKKFKKYCVKNKKNIMIKIEKCYLKIFSVKIQKILCYKL